MTLTRVSGLLLLVISSRGIAGQCSYVSGAQGVSYDLSKNLGAGGSQAVRAFRLQSGSTQVTQIRCAADAGDIRLYRSYVALAPVAYTQGNEQYLRLNDALSAALKITVPSGETFYPPVNNVHTDDKRCGESGCNLSVTDGSLSFKIRLDKPFVGRMVIPNLPVFSVYATTQDGDPLIRPIYQIKYSGAVEVPQSCELDAGTTIVMDFGGIGAPRFFRAGAGNKPAGVNPQSHTVAVKCKNTAAQALLSLHLETASAVGNAMVSDNPDVGFVVADSAQRPLTPNNPDSKIKFQLDDNSAASVPLMAWPVSVTGKTPAAGKFTAEGYLRIDFD